MLYGAGSSDPRVRFKVTGTKDLHCASKCIKKSLDPSWRETFSLPLTKDYSEDEKPIEWDLEKMRDMPRDKLWGIFGEWNERTWDNQMGYSIEVIKTKLAA